MPTEPDALSRPLDHLAERGAGSDPALVLKDRTLTYDELRTGIAQMAGWLAQRGFEPGARVASWCAKGELACLLPLAAPRAGLVHVPINPVLKRTQVAHILHDSGARLLIGTPSRIEALEPRDAPEGCEAVGEREALAAASGAAPLGPSRAVPDDLAAILYTSGSTGMPKGVMLSHANLWLGAKSVVHYLGLAPDDITLAVLPLSFDYGQNQLLSAWYAGGTVVPLDYLTAADLVKACARHAITTLAGVPPLWVQVAEARWPDGAAASLRRLTNSGGALTPGLVQRLRAIFPQADLFAMYGLTEAFRSTYLDPALIDANPTAMGTAIPLAEVLIVGDQGCVADDGEEGELVHCGPLVAQGYWRDAARTAERFRPAPAASRYGGTAVWSGDRVVRGTDGLLRFVGRRDAMIKSAGNRISPQEIEDAAVATGLAAQAAAFGVPDDRLGHAIVLVVRGSDAADEALRAALRRDLPSFMQPREMRWVDSMPLNPNGKIDRAAIERELVS